MTAVMPQPPEATATPREPRPTERKARRRWFWLLLALAAVMLCFAGVSALAFLLNEEQGPPYHQNREPNARRRRRQKLPSGQISRLRLARRGSRIRYRLPQQRLRPLRLEHRGGREDCPFPGRSVDSGAPFARPRRPQLGRGPTRGRSPLAHDVGSFVFRHRCGAGARCLPARGWCSCAVRPSASRTHPTERARLLSIGPEPVPAPIPAVTERGIIEPRWAEPALGIARGPVSFGLGIPIQLVSSLRLPFSS